MDKICCVCKQEKPLSEFHRDKSKRDGVVSSCKECAKIRAKAWHDDNLERHNEYCRNYHELHKNDEQYKARKREWEHRNIEKLREYQRARKRTIYAKNPEIYRQKDREWRRKNPEKVKAQGKRWRESNPDKTRAKYHRRRAVGEISSELLREMLDYQRGICAYCGGNMGETPTLEHIHPVFLGGTNDAANLCFVCEFCNYSKGHKTYDEWIVTRGW